MINEQTYHLINEYLNGELKGRELDTFKAKLKSDEELQQQVALQSSIIEAISAKREGELKQYIKQNTNSKKMWLINFKTILASAAIIVLLVSSFFIFKEFMDNTASQETASESEGTIIKKEKKSDIEDKITPIDTQSLAIEIPNDKNANGIPDEVKNENESPIAPTVEVVDDVAEIEADEEEVEEAEATDNVAKPEFEERYPKSKAQTETAASNDVIEVKSDQILAKKSYLVKAISPTFEEVKKSTTQVKDAQIEENDAASDQPESQIRTEYDVVGSRNIGVEYWKSVVNYKGYNYNGNTVKLYGIKQITSLEFKELDNRLYIKMGINQYYLEKNSSYNRLVEVTNPTLLNVLNE